MKHIFHHFLMVSAILTIITHLTNAKSTCQKIIDGEESDDVSVEEINQCYSCKGWYKITAEEAASVSPLINDVDEQDTNGWSWCATSESNAFEVTFHHPIKIAGLTVRSAIPFTWAKNLSVSYRDDQNVDANVKDMNGDVIFMGNTNDHTEKKIQFLVPVKTHSLSILIISYEVEPCFEIQLYSCDRKETPISGYAGVKALSKTAGLYQSAEVSTDCRIDVKTDCMEEDRCLQHLKDSNGCDTCACDIYFTGMKEGDIIVDASSRETLEVAYGVKKDPYNVMRAGLKGNRNRWDDHRSGQNYIVPYIFEESLTSIGRGAVPRAIAAIESVTCLRFRQRTNQQYYLRFFRGQGCYSYVGNIRRQGGQQISIGSGCEHTGIIQHEILHALGFWHEQSRKDRDQYVRILYQNIQKGLESNFDKREDSEDFGSPYDYKSVMHYSNRAFSANGKDTIQAIGNPTMSFGQRRGLSTEDTIQVNRMYQCTTTPTTTPVTTTSTTTRTPPPPTTTTTTKPTTCGDKKPARACEYWKGRGFCKRTYESYMAKYCAKTCEKCGSICKDRKKNCPEKKRRCNSENARRRANMLKRCPKTCEVC